MRTNINELDDIAKNYHMNASIQDIHIENICQDFFIEWLLTKIEKNTKVLELGFGDGVVTKSLVSSGSNLTLLEGSKLLFDKAQELYPHISCKYTLFEDFKPNIKYDLILASHVLEHLDNPAELLKTMYKWLSDNGLLIIVVPNKNSLHRQLSVLMGLQPELDTLSKRDLLVGHKRVYSLEMLENEAIEAKFIVREKKGFFLKILPNSMMLDYSDQLLKAMNHISFNLPVSIMANICLVVSK